MKSLCMFLCFCFFIVASYGNTASYEYIDKCLWHDRDCLKKSSNKALPHICVGVPGVTPPLDPLVIKEVKLEEPGLDVVFNDVTVTGACKCKIIDVERNIKDSYILIQFECPIQVHGSYAASGNLLLEPIEGKGPFHVESNKVYISVKAFVNTVDGSDGHKYWKLSKYEHSYEFKEKAHLKFENLYNGDKERAKPITQLMDQNWKDMVHFVGKPVIMKVIHLIVQAIKDFIKSIRVSDLELS